MTTRSRQQLSSILAVFSIIALLLLLVFVWTAGRNGVFSNVNDDMKAHGSYRLRTFSASDSMVSSTATIDEQQSTEHEHQNSHHSPHQHHHHHHHRHNESTTLHGKSFILLLLLLLLCFLQFQTHFLLFPFSKFFKIFIFFFSISFYTPRRLSSHKIGNRNETSF